MLSCHRPVIAVVTFLTPLARNSSSLKDGYVTLSQFTFLLKLIIKRTVSLLFYVRFLFFSELALGHLRYHLTDVPPQPNSQPGGVSDLDWL